MTRRALFLAALPLWKCTAAGQDTAIQWHPIATNGGIGIPSVSDGLSKFGVGVEVYSGNPTTEAFLIRLRYRIPGELAVVEQQKAVIRQREQQDAWTEAAFWTGQPVEVVDIYARELVFCGAEGTAR